MEIKHSSFKNIYTELQTLAEFLKANYEYYHHLPKIKAAKKHGDNSVFNKYNHAAFKFHTKFVQFWRFLDIGTQMTINSLVLSDKVMQDAHCQHPETFRKVVQDLKHIGKRAYIYSYGHFSKKYQQHLHIDKQHLLSNYPLIVEPWPEKWFIDFNDVHTVKQKLQRNGTSLLADTKRSANSDHAATVQTSQSNSSIIINLGRRSLANLTEICQSLRHLSHQESVAINYLAKDRDYYKSFASSAFNKINVDTNNGSNASSIVPKGVNSIRSNEAFARQSISSISQASLSASASYASIYAKQVAEVSEACNITSQAISDTHQARMSANALHWASLANRKNDLSAISSLKSVNARQKSD